MVVDKLKQFKCYVGINNLDEIASKNDKVLVMNILGNESRKVTPVSHVYSGANVVAGVQYGRPGVMKTEIGEIPVYSRLADAIKVHDFNTGVIYLPPTAVYHAVAELIHYNKALEKIVIVTEKLSVKDQTSIRAIAQANSVDVFGANSLGVADSWNHVRIGGGLGGDRPDELLVKGSIAVHSNSGNFSTTITEYMKTQGFGTTTIVSSGKDTIIQYPVAEFLYAAQNDPRTKAVVLYIEPGGFYEKIALDMIENGEMHFEKPIIACVTGHWKAKLTRAVGHAGALAGSNDDAASKERWFEEYFGVQGFDPEKPSRVGKRGVHVNSIQHIPLAIKAVFDKLGMETDFKPMGNLDLKPWFANDFGWDLPEKLKISVVKALSPYDKEIENVNKQLGAIYLRRNMRNASGASTMNSKTQVGELHGKPVTELASYTFENNIFFALTKIFPENKDVPLLNLVLNYLACIPDMFFDLVKQAENNGATPNEALMAPLALLGDNSEFRQASSYIKSLLGIYSELNIRDLEKNINWNKHDDLIKSKFEFSTENKSNQEPILYEILDKENTSGNVFQLIKYIVENENIVKPDDLIITGILFHTIYPALIKKKIVKDTLENAYSYFSIVAKVIILSTIKSDKNIFINDLIKRKNLKLLYTSFTETAFRAIFNAKPKETELKEFSTLLGITLTNGPGTISAKGAKESVSARNNISTAFIGFLANTGLAHGGNGFEGIEYMLNAFSAVKIEDPGIIDEKIDVSEIANAAAGKFAMDKKEAKSKGIGYKRIPGINHPVFKGKPVNIDPREDFIYKQFKSEGIDNIFWEFYKQLVLSLYKQKVTKNIYCVNIDAVIATITLKLLWKLFNSGDITENEMQKIGFNLFLFGRTAGIVAEIDDHRNRGTDMDCRTPASQTEFVV